MNWSTRPWFYSPSDQRRVNERRKKYNRDVALFVDVGGTLTIENIHTVYARHLGYAAEEESLRKRMKAGELTPGAFDKEIEKILISKKFSREKANEIADKVELRDNAETLLQSEDFDIYLISLAPSFYIDWLLKNKASKGAVIYHTASKFKFDKSGLLVSGVETQNASGKGAVARVEVKNYLLSAGIGDDIEFDSDFLSHCTFAFLVQPNQKYLYSSDLNYILDVVRSAADSMRKGCEKNSQPVRRANFWKTVGWLGAVASGVVGGALFPGKVAEFLGLPSAQNQVCECGIPHDGQAGQAQ